jgi:beta-lactamase regulating signal transducer with metallopeptidase domain
VSRELRAVVAHELAHVRRHDYLVNMLQRVVESLLFYHPAVWWLSARVRAEREHAADEAAVEICDDPAVLASALVRLEETRSDRIAIAATGGSVANRVARLLNGEPDRSGWQPIMATVSFIGLWAIAGVWQFSAMQSEAPRPGSKSDSVEFSGSFGSGGSRDKRSRRTGRAGSCSPQRKQQCRSHGRG